MYTKVTTKLTQEEVIDRATKKHNGKYDYSKLRYKNIISEVIIICPTHGEFLQTPQRHLNGCGCPKCNGGVAITTEQVLLDFFEEHGDLYDYSQFIYVNNHTKGVIICKIHGEFLQNANKHKYGHGCPRCSGQYATLDDIIAGFRKEHGYKYDYSKFVFVNVKTKSIIICPEHGEFLQNANSHQQGSGCPRCKSSRGERAILNILKSNAIKFETQKKFDDCKNISPLPFDFYLPDHNLCIEFDGKQHFEPVSAWGGGEGLKRNQLCDSIKNNYCKDNNIKLIRIPYTKIKEIESILSHLFEPPS